MQIFWRNKCKFEKCGYSHWKDSQDLKIGYLENQVTDLTCEVKEISQTNKDSLIEVKKILRQVADVSNNLKGVIKQIKFDRKQQENDKEKSEAIEKMKLN